MPASLDTNDEVDSYEMEDSYVPSSRKAKFIIETDDNGEEEAFHGEEEAFHGEDEANGEAICTDVKIDHGVDLSSIAQTDNLFDDEEIALPSSSKTREITIEEHREVVNEDGEIDGEDEIVETKIVRKHKKRAPRDRDDDDEDEVGPLTKEEIRERRVLLSMIRDYLRMFPEEKIGRAHV